MGGEGRKGRHAGGDGSYAGWRTHLVVRVRRFLEEEGYIVVDYADTKSCVDLIARRDDKLLLIRVLGNIDALREESAREFLRLAAVLHAYPVVVGTHSKRGPLEPGVVYWRYEIPVLSPETFEAAIRGELPLAEEYRGRRLAIIDHEALRRRREELGLTLRQLADLVGTTKESIYRYERGQPLHEQMAVKLEKVLNIRLRLGVNPFHVPRAERATTHSDRFSPLSRILPLSVFRRTPWDALAERKLMISEFQGNVYRRAELLRRGRHVVARYVALYSAEGGREKVSDVPVLSAEDIEDVRSERDLMRLLREKDEKG